MFAGGRGIFFSLSTLRYSRAGDIKQRAVAVAVAVVNYTSVQTQCSGVSAEGHMEEDSEDTLHSGSCFI